MKFMKGLRVCILISICILFWSTSVSAVVRTVPVIGTTGDPVPNTKVTIFDADENQVGEGETDDDGALIFDFPGEGKYRLQWADGSQVVDIHGFWTPPHTAIAIAVPVMVGGGLLIGSSMDGDGDTGDTPAGPSDTSSDAPTHDGMYTTDFSVASDPGGHDPFIELSAASPFDLEVTTGSISVTGSPPFVDVTGSLNDNSFSATGSGTVAGIESVSVSMTGTFNNGAWSGNYTMGDGGELPGGQAITYNFSGSK